jgi:hypothetical protein
MTDLTIPGNISHILEAGTALAGWWVGLEALQVPEEEVAIDGPGGYKVGRLGVHLESSNRALMGILYFNQAGLTSSS